MRIAVVAVLVLFTLPAGAAAAGPPDRTPPRIAVDGVGATVSREALAAGLRVRIRADEAVAGAAEVVLGHRGLTIPRLPDRIVASRVFGVAAGVRTVRLRPALGLPTGRVRVRLRVVAFDAAGNLAGRSIGLDVR